MSKEEKDEWRKNYLGLAGWYLEIGDKCWPLPEWLVDTILREHQLAQKFSDPVELNPIGSLEAAEARIAELEGDMKRQAGSYLQAQAAWEKRESGIEADAERAWELVREAIRGRRSITDWLSRAEAALAARSGSH